MSPILVFKEGDEFFLVSDGGMSMKKICSSISRSDPANGTSLFQVNFLLLQEKNKSILEYRFEVPFLQGEISEFFQNPQERKHKFYIMNIGF